MGLWALEFPGCWRGSLHGCRRIGPDAFPDGFAPFVFTLRGLQYSVSPGQVLHKAVEPVGPSCVGSMAEDCAVDSRRPCLLREL